MEKASSIREPKPHGRVFPPDTHMIGAVDPSGRKRHAALPVLREAFANHPRRWRDFLYVYPVISRRSRGLSIGINLNPDAACNFDCVYCSVDRSVPPKVRRVELPVLAAELEQMVARRAALFDEPEFRAIPPEWRRLNDFAFSGDGEPTASPVFPEAVELVTRVRREAGLGDVKVVVITDACYLTRPAVAAALEVLDANGGEIWAKLDAGTEEYFRRVNRPNYPLRHVLNNIRSAGQKRSLVIQSLFLRLHGDPPPPAEIEAYLERLRELLAAGTRVTLVQVYTVVRRTAEPYATALTEDELERIAARVRTLGVRAEVYP